MFWFHLFFIYFLILLSGLPQFGGLPLFGTTPVWVLMYVCTPVYVTFDNPFFTNRELHLPTKPFFSVANLAEYIPWSSSKLLKGPCLVDLNSLCFGSRVMLVKKANNSLFSSLLGLVTIFLSIKVYCQVLLGETGWITNELLKRFLLLSLEKGIQPFTNLARHTCIIYTQMLYIHNSKNLNTAPQTATNRLYIY